MASVVTDLLDTLDAEFSNEDVVCTLLVFDLQEWSNAGMTDARRQGMFFICVCLLAVCNSTLGGPKLNSNAWRQRHLHHEKTRISMSEKNSQRKTRELLAWPRRACVRACIDACMHVCVRAWALACLRACVLALVNAFVCACVCTCVCSTEEAYSCLSDIEVIDSLA